MKDLTLAIMTTGRAQLGQTSEQVNVWGSRLATWLIVGNAAAMALAIQVLREVGSGPHAQIAFQSGRLFGIGLGLAFIGATVSYFGLIWALSLQSRAAALIEQFAHKASLEDWHRQRGEPLTHEQMEAQTTEMKVHADDLDATRKRMQSGPFRLSVAAMLLLAASAILFVAGVSIPLAKLEPVRNQMTIQDAVAIARLARETAAAERSPEPLPIASTQSKPRSSPGE